MDEHRRNQLWDFISSGVPSIPKDDFYLPLPEAEYAPVDPTAPPPLVSCTQSKG